VFVSQAITELQGRPDLFAWRQTGEILQLTPNGRILDVRTGRPKRMIFKVPDLMSNAWFVGDAQKLRAAFPQLFDGEAA
jgi:hypothetical protein